MENRQLTIDDYNVLTRFFKECYLPVDFFDQVSNGKKYFLKSLLTLDILTYGFYFKGQLVALGTFEKNEELTLSGLLFSREAAFSKQDLKDEFLKIGRKHQVKKISLGKGRSFFNGDVFIPETKTALVLGGGGARGSYEIGVYQAFHEAGFTFNVICGTSVGGLNGGLILQDNLPGAQNLWETIQTGQIIDFNEEMNEAFTYRADFLKKALLNVGISSAPLKKLIGEYMDVKKIQESDTDFFVITTMVPQLKEVVVNLKEVPEDEVADWLIASASFFPGMSLTTIQGQNYMDGGYKNNLPQDVALKNQAQLLVTIDAKGPGIIKNVTFPKDTCEIFLKTPWALGEILYFDGLTAKGNMTLGYLEGQKALGLATGYWYTFQNDFLKEQFALAQEFLKQNEVNQEAYEDLKRLYQKEVSPMNLGMAALELLGRYFSVLPNVYYTLDELVELILKSKELPAERVALEGKTPFKLLQERLFERLLNEESLGKGNFGLKTLFSFLQFLEKRAANEK